MFGELKPCKCIVCGTKAFSQQDYNCMASFYDCPVCGRYELILDLSSPCIDFDLNHLGSYLLYNGFKFTGSERRYFTNRSKEWCDEWSKKCKNGDNAHGHPVLLSKENVENWYPKTFAEKIDKILLYLGKHIKHIGEELTLTIDEAYGVLFVDRYDYSAENRVEREANAQLAQANYMLEYLADRNYIRRNKNTSWWSNEQKVVVSLQPDGYARIDELQRNTLDGKNVLVAMKFGDDTKKLREAIRLGISDAGYIAVFIDEVQHNDFITPELLKHIKNSKFVVVDLTHQNNGAYFEEGYAMGLGKPVIQLCKKGIALHFDVAQKNTIMWDTESDIPQLLKNRIIATID